MARCSYRFVYLVGLTYITGRYLSFNGSTRQFNHGRFQAVTGYLLATTSSFSKNIFEQNISTRDKIFRHITYYITVLRYCCTTILLYCFITNRVCTIIGTDILLLYEAILHLIPPHPFKYSPWKWFSPTLFEISLFIAFCSLCQITANFYQKKYSQRETLHSEAFLPKWHPQNPSLPRNQISRGH